MVDVFVLFYVHALILDYNDSTFVVVGPAIVWSRENRNYRRESVVTTPSMHLVAINLNLMCADD